MEDSKKIKLNVIFNFCHGVVKLLKFSLKSKPALHQYVIKLPELECKIN